MHPSLSALRHQQLTTELQAIFILQESTGDMWSLQIELSKKNSGHGTLEYIYPFHSLTIA